MSPCLGDIALLTGKVKPLVGGFACGDDMMPVVEHFDVPEVTPSPSYHGTFLGDPDSDGHTAQVVFTAPSSVIVVSLPAGLVEVYPRASVQGIVEELECKIPTTDMSYVGRAEDSLGFAMKQLRSAFTEHGSVSAERGHTSR